eukprot:8768693-Pyramimonas_sp.AAC.1
MEHTADPALPPLSDPFRHVAHALLVGVEALQTSKEFELQQAHSPGCGARVRWVWRRGARGCDRCGAR